MSVLTGLVVTLIDKLGLGVNQTPSSPLSRGCPASALKMGSGASPILVKLTHVPSSIVTYINGTLRRFVLRTPLAISNGQYNKRGPLAGICFSHHPARAALDITKEAFGYPNSNLNYDSFITTYEPGSGVRN